MRHEIEISVVIKSVRGDVTAWEHCDSYKQETSAKNWLGSTCT